MSMAEGEPERAHYTAQKFPLEIAQTFLAKVPEYRRRTESERPLSVLAEIEEMAMKLV